MTKAHQDTSSQIRQAVPAVLKASTFANAKWGVVSAVSGQLCTFTVSGTGYPNTRALRPYTPTNGDTALGLEVGTDLFLIAAI